MGRKTCSWLYFMEYKIGWKYSFSFWSAIGLVGENRAVVCYVLEPFVQTQKKWSCAIVCISFRFHVQWHHASSLQWAMVGVYTAWKWQKNKKQKTRLCFILLNCIYLFFFMSLFTSTGPESQAWTISVEAKVLSGRGERGDIGSNFTVAVIVPRSVEPLQRKFDIGSRSWLA